MKYYAVVQLDILDRQWVGDYVTNVTALVAQHGGRYLARSTAAEIIEGGRKPPEVFVIVEWPSKAAAVDFYHSEAYRPYREARLQGARCDFALVAGEDLDRPVAVAG
ncbi:MAG: DUF1330 domain-containing protein [Opitutae bacterium]|nr:DUF1330 domain-containing protein [Opitutae bacterium]